MHGQRQQQQERDDREHAQRAELASQVGVGALLDAQRDGFHVLGAVVGGDDLAPEQAAHDEGDDRDHPDDADQGQVRARRVTSSGIVSISTGTPDMQRPPADISVDRATISATGEV